MADEHVNEHVKINILPGMTGSVDKGIDRKRIRKLVKDRLLLPSKEPYHKVQVEVELEPQGSLKALIVSMLRANTYTADVVKMNVDDKYEVQSVEPLSPGEEV